MNNQYANYLPQPQYSGGQSPTQDQDQLNTLQNNDTGLEIRVPSNIQFSYGGGQPITPIAIHPGSDETNNNATNVSFVMPTEGTPQFITHSPLSPTYGQQPDCQSPTFYNSQQQQQNVTFQMPSQTQSTQVTFALPPSPATTSPAIQYQQQQQQQMGYSGSPIIQTKSMSMNPPHQTASRPPLPYKTKQQGPTPGIKIAMAGPPHAQQKAQYSAGIQMLPPSPPAAALSAGQSDIQANAWDSQMPNQGTQSQTKTQQQGMMQSKPFISSRPPSTSMTPVHMKAAPQSSPSPSLQKKYQSTSVQMKSKVAPPQQRPQFVPPSLSDKTLGDNIANKNVVGVHKSQPMQKVTIGIPPPPPPSSSSSPSQYGQSTQPIVATTKKGKETRLMMPMKKTMPVTQKMTIKTAIKVNKPPTNPTQLSPRYAPRLITNQDQSYEIEGSPDDVDIYGYDDSDDEDEDDSLATYGGANRPSKNREEIHSLLKTYSQRYFTMRKGISASAQVGTMGSSEPKVTSQRSSYDIRTPSTIAYEDDDNDDEEDDEDEDDDEENQKHEREINALNSKIYKLEKIIEDDHKRIEALMAEKEAEKKRMLDDTLMQVNSVFSAIPIRSSLLESGRFVLFTGLVVEDESVFEKLAKESIAAFSPQSASSQSGQMMPVGQKKLGSKIFGGGSSGSGNLQQQQLQQQQSAMNLQLNFLKRSYVLKKKGDDNMFYIRGQVGFKTDFEGAEVHVVGWIQRANYSNIEKIPSSNIKVMRNGFQFSIEHGDPRMMDGSILNWIAYSVPRANQDLMSTMDAIMNPQRFGKGEAAQTEIHAIVKRFLQKYHTDEKDVTGRTLMHISATFGNTALIKYLLKKGADINAIDNSGWTPLLCAISSGYFETALAMLESGAYPNAISESGNNALHYLLRTTEVDDWYVKVLMTLLDRGCNVNAENNDGNTPLHIAIQRCPSIDVIKMLFTLSKPSINAFNKSGYSPIHAAIERGAANIVSVLIESGSDLTAASPDLGTPLDFAHLLKNTEIAGMLTKEIARRAAAPPSSSASSGASQSATGDEGDLNIPGMVCLEIVAGERIIGATDPYCIIDVGENKFRTEAASKTDSPVWNKSFRVNTVGVSEIKATVLNFNLLKSTKPIGYVTVPVTQECLLPGAITDEWYDITSPNNANMGRMHIVLRVPEARAAKRGGDGSDIAELAAGGGGGGAQVLAGLMELKPKQMMQYSFNMSGKIYDREFEFESGFSTMPPAFWEDWTAAASTAERMPYAFKEGTAAEGRYIEHSWACITHKAIGKSPIFDKGAATYKFVKYVNLYEHYNFFTLVDETPIVFCAARSQELNAIRLIILTPRDDFCLIIPGPGSSSAQWKAPQYSAAIRNAIPFVKNKKLYRFKDDEVAEDLIQDFMRLFTYNRCKFGLVYCAPGQSDERSFLANETGSADFDEFCEFIGEKVPLLDFPGFSGGLSKTSNLSGTHTIYTRYGSTVESQEIEIVFHVSTMLPNNPNDPQKIEKKRHIGNDFVVLLFKECADENDVVDVSSFRSKFNHIFIVVNPVKEEGKPTRYRVTVAANSDIRPFPPFIPQRTGNIFEKNDEFRDWLLMKLVNAERSALNIPLVRGGNMNSRNDKLITIIAKSSKKKN